MATSLRHRVHTSQKSNTCSAKTSLTRVKGGWGKLDNAPGGKRTLSRHPFFSIVTTFGSKILHRSAQSKIHRWHALRCFLITGGCLFFFFFAAVLVYDISFCRLQTLEVHIYHVKEEAYFELFFFSLLGMFHLNPDVEAVFREVDHGLSMGKGRR